jgi:hypothetical protein
LQHPLTFAVPVRREAEPFNAFTDDARQLRRDHDGLLDGHAGLGNVTGTVPRDVEFHFLTHHSYRFAVDSILMLLLTNEFVRHANAAAVMARIRDNPAAWAFSVDAMNDPTLAQLEHAVAHPGSKAASQLLQRIMPFFSPAGNGGSWSRCSAVRAGLQSCASTLHVASDQARCAMTSARFALLTARAPSLHRLTAGGPLRRASLALKL